MKTFPQQFSLWTITEPFIEYLTAHYKRNLIFHRIETKPNQTKLFAINYEI